MWTEMNNLRRKYEDLNSSYLKQQHHYDDRLKIMVG